MQAALLSSKSGEWYTPPELEQRIRLVALGDARLKWDLDPCADPEKSIPARMHWTAKDNGLGRPPFSIGSVYSVFLNPPYGRDLGLWVDQFNHDKHNLGEPLQAWLLPARTDTKWFRSLVSHVPCIIVLLQGRIKFNGPNGAQHSAPFPSVIVLKDTDIEVMVGIEQRARQVFRTDGIVCRVGW